MGCAQAMRPLPATGPQTAARDATTTARAMNKGHCPSCGYVHEFEPLELLPRIVPMCETCEEAEAAKREAKRRAAGWKRLRLARKITGPSRPMLNAVVCLAVFL